MTSKKFSLNWRDVVRGALVSTLTSGIVAFQVMLDSGTFVLKPVLMSAVGGFVGYLTKNFFTAPVPQTPPPPSPN